MSRKFLSPLGLLAQSTNPASGSIGDTYYNTSDNKVYTYNGSSWVATGVQGTQGTSGLIAQTSAPVDTTIMWLDTDEVAVGASVLNGFNAQTGNYTLVVTDIYKLVTVNSASTVTVTVPASIFTATNQVYIQQIGAGQVIVSGGSVTITSSGGTSSAPKTNKQYSMLSIICTAANTFTIVGDIV